MLLWRDSNDTDIEEGIESGDPFTSQQIRRGGDVEFSRTLEFSTVLTSYSGMYACVTTINISDNAISAVIERSVLLLVQSKCCESFPTLISLLCY